MSVKFNSSFNTTVNTVSSQSSTPRESSQASFKASPRLRSATMVSPQLSPKGSPRSSDGPASPLTVRSLDRRFSRAGEEPQNQNIAVALRVRPFMPRELALSGDVSRIEPVLHVDNKTVTIVDPSGRHHTEAFEFDHIFWSVPHEQNAYDCDVPVKSQADVFDAIGAPTVKNSLTGFNACIFAYGQTGSGKTFTMLGSDDQPGVAPRVVAELFDAIDGANNQLVPSERMQTTIELSFMEIYNEKVKDLLMMANQSIMSPTSGGKEKEFKECKVRHHPEVGTFVDGLTRTKVPTEESCLQLIESGMKYRSTASTKMNDQSSRSHAIFQLCVRRKNAILGTERISIINLVDLAGSERVKMSGASGNTLNEAKNINMSLTTLRRVIDILIENAKITDKRRSRAVPPYRESLLTWVLSDTLGGNSMSTMIAAVSPHASNIEDTLGTLRYALKAKAIVCAVKINETKSTVVVDRMQKELDRLRQDFEDSKQTMSTQLASDAQREIAEREREIEEKKSELVKMQEERDSLAHSLNLHRARLEEAEVRATAADRLQSELEAVRKHAEDAAKRSKDIESERDATRSELHTILRRSDSLVRRHDNLRRTNDEKDASYTKEKLKCACLRLIIAFHLKRREREKDMAKSELLESCDEAYRAKQRVAACEREITTLKESVATLQGLLKNAHAEKSFVQKKLDEQRSCATEERLYHEQALHEARDALSKAEVELALQTSTIQAMQDEASRLSGDEKLVLRAKSLTEEKLRDATARIARLEDEARIHALDMRKLQCDLENERQMNRMMHSELMGMRESEQIVQQRYLGLLKTHEEQKQVWQQRTFPISATRSASPPPTNNIKYTASDRYHLGSMSPKRKVPVGNASHRSTSMPLKSPPPLRPVKDLPRARLSEDKKPLWK
eukprot:PhM_4_TR5932/c0_g1_i1/m.84083/K17914/KIF13; kinesin family member 13